MLYPLDWDSVVAGLVARTQPDQTIGEIREQGGVCPYQYRSRSSKGVQRYDFLAMPVVDRERRLVGIVTVDEIVIDILERERLRMYLCF